MGDFHGNDLYAKGVDALENDHIYLALSCFEQAAYLKKTPLCCSYLAYCLAKVRGQYPEAISLCQGALKEDPDNPLHYLHLGRVYAMAGQRMKALSILRQGLRCDDTSEILRELTQLGERKHPLFPSLSRNHPLNKYLGLALSKLGIR
ncbi:MAG TPA: tetratricopeptide repeat protein [Geobacteraceae bacterium]|nr:tetratricopeptide repeat protein [Geobacteraceae bacterium]